MEGKRAKAKLFNLLWHQRKRITAFVLTFAMVLTNIVNDFTVAFAAEIETVTAVFTLNGEDIQNAIDEAIAGGDAYDPSELEISAKSSSLEKAYEKLLGGNGEVYEFFPAIDGINLPDGAELRTFINSRTQEVIFLFINESSTTYAFRVNVDGYQTAKVTVTPHSSNLEKEAPAVKPEPTAPKEEPGTTVEEGKIENESVEGKTPEEITGSDEADNGETPEDSEAGKENTDEEQSGNPGQDVEITDGEASEDNNLSDEAGDTADDDKSDDAVTDDNESGDVADSGSSDDTATDDNSSEDAVAEDNSSDNAAEDNSSDDAVADDSGSNDSADDNSSDDTADDGNSSDEASDSGDTVAMSIYNVPRVAEPLADAIEDTEAVEVLETSEEETTEAETTEAETDEETEAETEVETEPETLPAEDEGLPVVSEEALENETEISNETNEETATVGETNEETVPETVPEEELAGEFKDGVLLDDVNYVVDTMAPSTDVVDNTPDEVALTGSISGKAYNQIKIYDSYTARAFKVDLDKLLVGVTTEGYNVDYTVDPVGAATIKGRSTVERGDDLTFTVVPQIGYEISEITVNGQELDVDIASDSDAQEAGKYTVYGVSEDLEIVVSMEETGLHPSFFDSVEINGVTITAAAEEGILPEGTELSVEEVTTQIEQAVKEKLESEQQKVMDTVLAYDINLMLDGEKLDNSWSDNGYVEVTFSGERIEAMTAEAESVEIFAADDISSEQMDASTAADVTADTLTLESVSEENVADEVKDSVSFDAKHFTVYVVGTLTSTDSTHRYTMYVGDNPLRIYTNDTTKTDGTWSSSNTAFATVKADGTYTPLLSSKKRPAALVTAKAPGTVEVKYTYTSSKKTETDTFYITVLSRNPTITFNKNDGNGTAPDAITAEEGTQIELPSGDGLWKKDEVFVGWSTDKNANGVGNYKENNGTIYQAGYLYDMPSKDTILYAAWSYQNVDAEFYIRLDGVIPTEPQGHKGSEYTGAIKIDHAIKTGTFYYNGTYPGVEDKLNSTPTDSQIKAVKADYNPTTQYVLWYVIKHESTWHVDGVLLQKDKVNLSYDPNAPAGTWSNMPDGTQYYPNTSARVSSLVPIRAGYIFTGWNTKADGSGTSYVGNDAFTIKENTTLYAQWRAKSNVIIYYTAGEGGRVTRPLDSLNPDNGIPTGSTAEAYDGYHFEKWIKVSDGSAAGENEKLVPEKDPNTAWVNGTTYKAIFTANIDTGYKVEHYQQNLENDRYTLKETEDLTGTTDTIVHAVSKSYPGFTYNPGVEETKISGTITGDGELVLRLYYTRNSYTVTYKYDGTVPEGASELPKAATYKYGASVTIAADATAPGYTFNKWSRTESFEMPSHDVEITGSFTKNNYGYTVNYYKDSVGEGNLLGSDEGSGVFESYIPYTDGSYLPSGYVIPGEVSGQRTITETAENNVLNVVYGKNQNLGYTVNYYKDSVGEGNLLGSDEGSGTFGDAVPYEDGKYLPGGYVTPGEVSGQTTITETAENNVLNVVYGRNTNLGYTVIYYKDAKAYENRLGTDTGTGTYGDTIPYTDGKYLPDGYVMPGSVTGQLTITENPEENKVYIVYSKNQNLGYTVNYYKDSIGEGNLLGSENGTGTFGDPIPYEDGNYLPSGYVTPGSLSGQRTITETDAANVLNVVYGRNTSLTYTVNYYKDSVREGNLLGSDGGTGTFGDTIPYTDGKYLPGGYVTPGEVSGQTMITPVSESNVLNVVYGKNQNLGYTVNYYKDSIEEGNLLGSDEGTGTFKANIPYEDGKHLPGGYVTPGEVSGQTTITETAEANVLNVVYGKNQNLGYTVNYYKDSVGEGNLLGSDEGRGTFESDIPYEDGKYLPAGYVTPGEVSGQRTITEAVETNVLNVVYGKNQNLGYTVNYYKDSVGEGNLLGSDEGSGTFGDAVPYEDGKYLPGGYVTPGEVSGQRTITEAAENNVLNVVYGKNQNLGYMVNYYKDSIEEGNLLGSEEGIGTFGDTILYTDGMYLPSGYVTPATVSGQRTITEIPENNILNVVYEVKGEFEYEVHYFYEDADRVVKEDTASAVHAKGTFEEKIPYTDESPREFEGKNYVLDDVKLGNDLGIITIDREANYINVYYAIDEIGTEDPEKPDAVADKYQVTFTYETAGHGSVTGVVKEVVTKEEVGGKIDVENPAFPRADVTAVPDSGYNFMNWTSDVVSTDGRIVFADTNAVSSAGFTSDTIFKANFLASDATTYKVEMYFEVNGKYPSTTENVFTRQGITDSEVSVTNADKAGREGYIYDTSAKNVEQGSVKGDNSLVLKLYFKQQFTVTYDPGTHGSFNKQVTTGIGYGDGTPEFVGNISSDSSRYTFVGWSPAVSDKVTGSVVYVAQWNYRSSGGSTGGGGGSDTKPGRGNGGDTGNGPGSTTTINPGDVPMANLPNDITTGENILIDDGEVPLAALPKTGNQSGMNAVLAMLSGMLLAAYLTISKKKDEES